MEFSLMDLGLNDKVVIVTGGGSGIGAAVSLGLAREGALPVIVARSALRPDFETELLALAPEALFLQTELSDDEA